MMAEESARPTSAKTALKRHMGLIALTLYGVGDMLGGGVYGLVGRAAREMGNGIWLAMLTSAVAAVLTGLSYASLGARHPRAGGAAYITHRAFNIRFLSYMVGLAVLASGLLSMATNTQNFAGQFRGFDWAVPPWAIMLGFIAALSLVNFIGIRESTWLNILCTVIEVAGLMFVVVVGLSYWGRADLLDFRAPANPSGAFSAPLLFTGAVVTFFSFLGFEDMLNVAEETKNPERVFPWAVALSILIATLIYVAIAITAVSVVEVRDLADPNNKSPLVDVVRVAAWFPTWIFAIVAAFAITNTALLNYIMGSRLMYGMAGQGLIPRWLGAIHPRTRTPHRAILAFMVIVTALAFAGEVGVLARSTSTLLLMTFMLVNAALIRLKLNPEEPRCRFEVPIIVPALGIVVCGALVVNAGREVLLTAAAVLAVIAALYVVLRPKTVVVEVA